jgi:hypothetical protein
MFFMGYVPLANQCKRDKLPEEILLYIINGANKVKILVNIHIFN